MISVGFDCTDPTKGEASQTIHELETGEHDGSLGHEAECSEPVPASVISAASQSVCQNEDGCGLDI